MKIALSNKSLGIFLAINFATLPVLLFALYQAKPGPDRVLLIAMVCAVSGAVFAVVVSLYTIRALRNIAVQLQHMSAGDLKPIELGATEPHFTEIRHLLLSLNKLLREITRDKAARDAVIQSEKMITL